MEAIPVKTQGLKNVINAFYTSNNVGERDLPFALGEGNYQYMLGNQALPLTPVYVDTFAGEVKREVLEIAGCGKKACDTLLKNFPGNDFVFGYNFKKYSCV
jgi:hypothetical protein